MGLSDRDHLIEGISERADFVVAPMLARVVQIAAAMNVSIIPRHLYRKGGTNAGKPG